ncbi:Cystathionine beta-synthase [Neolecta irregularis DAH-3]|uniref:Cystathionine beta-synthase n=1 Tax=Neolecta irregularis (strain DAH-3) TaxID=1198029 RepID=A0A1U7LLX2_NEOID|nr:Cystathionine beta-synthase [Neolecta irregularis DAH-3]|eukprot:OLL23647.1 Cystathionine beta-synthase [Neolecta irregularis DAH-3]
MSTTALPASQHRLSKYRGASVEDLQLSPAVSILESTSLSAALLRATDRDFSQITVLDERDRSLRGYLTDSRLQELLKTENPDEPVQRYITEFDRGRKYVLITPDTDLDELERFLEKEEFAIVTDVNRKFVLGVATRSDLEEFNTRRPML